MVRRLDRQLDEQIRYYRARAPEYDAWAERDGAYDRGARNHGWQAEKARLVAALAEFQPRGDVLEIAGGTGQWTHQLVRHADSLTVVDAAPEALEHNRRKLAADVERVEYHVTDFFDWEAPERYDVIFFSYWLSHVPPERFVAFWERVAACLKPGARVFLIDNIATAYAARLDPEIPGEDDVTVLRPAPDGNLYRVWKVLWEPGDLERELRTLGWSFEAYATGTYFMWAEGRRADQGLPA
ncbi:hypothetical protein BH20CHL7_BH20CHL7_04770 [soil metagenome]